ncbi:hypothetical protein NHQ30_001282 [Ciborinia camelliae]|nr:hypothetical protein NHQ30_001282 [Ciborinia camelliae]
MHIFATTLTIVLSFLMSIATASPHCISVNNCTLYMSWPENSLALTVGGHLYLPTNVTIYRKDCKPISDINMVMPDRVNFNILSSNLDYPIIVGQEYTSYGIGPPVTYGKNKDGGKTCERRDPDDAGPNATSGKDPRLASTRKTKTDAPRNPATGRDMLVEWKA